MGRNVDKPTVTLDYYIQIYLALHYLCIFALFGYEFKYYFRRFARLDLQFTHGHRYRCDNSLIMAYR